MQKISLCSTHQREQRSSVPKGCPTCTRINIERDIVLRTVAALLAAGYELNIDNGGDEYELPNFTLDAALLTQHLMETDDEYLMVATKGEDNVKGWVRFVYGNDGYDVISDYTTNLEPIIEPIMDYIEQEYE